MNQEQLNAMKERAAKVTPGPWECRYLGHSRPQYSVMNETEYVAHIYDVNDAEFIAFAREDVPALVSEVERLQVELSNAKECNERLCEVVKEFINYWDTTNDTRPLLEIVTDAHQALGGEVHE